MAAVVPGVWGIDIGQSALKALRLEVIDNELTATAFDYIEHPKILSQPDADADQLTREALDTFLERNPVKGDVIAISVPGQSGLARFVKLPPVEEKKIPEIVKFEAKQQIPFPLEEVIWDYQKVGSGDVADGFAIDTEIGLFAMKRDMIARFLGQYSGVKLEVHKIQMAPLALVNYLTYEQLGKGGPNGTQGPAADFSNAPPGKKKCVVGLDIGSDSSILVVTDAGKIIWQRQLNIGGGHFTRALTKELKLTFAKAEHLKRNAAKSAELPQILKALKNVLNEFVVEVQRSLGYFTNTHRDAHIGFMVGMGNAFKLPGLPKYFSEKLSIDIRRPTSFPRLSGESVTSAPAFAENILSFPVAYGLALQGLGLARLTTNLLPPEIAVERKIRAKKPYAVAAGAMLLLGSSVAAVCYSLPYAAAHDPALAEQMKDDAKAKDRAAAVNKAVAASRAQVDTMINQNRAIIAGQDERLNHLALTEYINLCLPVPGPQGNMNEPDTKVLWNTREGQTALARYERQTREGVDPRLAADDESRINLPLLDVEAVYGRYVPDLKAYHEFVGKQTLKETGVEFGGEVDLGGLTDEEKKNPPLGAGWVYEIRGSTYYNPKDLTLTTDKFLARTLIRNLRRLQTQPPYNKLLPPVPVAADTAATPAPAADAAKTLVPAVSHPFLWSVIDDPAPTGTAFKRLDTSLVDWIVTSLQTAVPADGTATGMPGNPGMPAPGTPMPTDGAAGTAIPWAPISTGVSTGVSGLTGERPISPRGPSMPAPRSPAIPGGASGGAAGDSPWAPGLDALETTRKKTGKGDTPSILRNRLIRHEFVVLLVWHEQTPSDKFITPLPESATPGVPSPGGPGMSRPGVPGSPGMPRPAPPRPAPARSDP